MLNGAPGGWAIGHEGQLQDMCHFSVSPPPTGAAIWARSNVWCSEVWMYTQLLSLATGTCNFTSWNIVQCYNQFSPCKTVGIALWQRAQDLGLFVTDALHNWGLHQVMYSCSLRSSSQPRGKSELTPLSLRPWSSVKEDEFSPKWRTLSLAYERRERKNYFYDIWKFPPKDVLKYLQISWHKKVWNIALPSLFLIGCCRHLDMLMTLHVMSVMMSSSPLPWSDKN